MSQPIKRAIKGAIRKRHRQLLIGAVVIIALVALLEAALRFGYGLGNPVLIERDSTIEYMLRPNQDVMRFGKRTATNAFGMRSRAVDARRSDPNELRVLVVGDSVVNGGVLTDNAELATTLLEADLRQRTGRPVFVGNISAGSWGPPNMLAYFERFGFFDADALLIVLSSTDAADNSFNGPINEVQLPEHRPFCAIAEFVTRYLPKYLPGTAPEPEVGDGDRLNEPESIAACDRALRTLLAKARERGIRVVILQHWELPEITAHQARRGHDLIAQIADDEGVVHIDLGPIMSADADGPAPLYRDRIHLNAEGQRMLERALADALLVVP